MMVTVGCECGDDDYTLPPAKCHKFLQSRFNQTSLCWVYGGCNAMDSTAWNQFYNTVVEGFECGDDDHCMLLFVRTS